LKWPGTKLPVRGLKKQKKNKYSGNSEGIFSDIAPEFQQKIKPSIKGEIELCP